MDRVQEVRQSEEQESGRKAWHAPTVRWQDPRDAENGFSAVPDGGTSGSPNS